MKDDPVVLASAEQLFRWGAWLLIPVYGLLGLNYLVKSGPVEMLNGLAALLMIGLFMVATYKFATVSREPRVMRVAYSIGMLAQPFALILLWYLRSNAQQAESGQAKT